MSLFHRLGLMRNIALFAIVLCSLYGTTSRAAVITQEGSSSAACAAFGERAVSVTSVRLSQFSPMGVDVAPIDSNTVRVLISGPTLGSMDSRGFKATLRCEADRIVLTSDLERSANYDGSALKNVVWQPVIELKVETHSPEIEIDGSWTMHDSNGVEISRDLNTKEQTFPIIFSKKITLQ